MKNTEFKPFFKGYLKLYLHDVDGDRLVSRMEYCGDWQTKRNRILKKHRRFQIAFHIFDRDGHKWAHELVWFKGRGGNSELSSAIFQSGNKLVSELRESYDNADIDLVNSYAVVRV